MGREKARGSSGETLRSSSHPTETLRTRTMWAGQTNRLEWGGVDSQDKPSTAGACLSPSVLPAR
jgi:hypothetical protein